MGNQLGIQISCLSISVYRVHALCMRTRISLVVKHCQLHNTCKKTLTVPTVRLHSFYCKTESQEMDTENGSHQDKLQTNSLDASYQTTKLLGEFEQKQDVAAKTLSRRALKRIARAQKHKEYKRQKREENRHITDKDDVGCSVEDLQQTSYYFENGVRKVYPYSYVFATYAKGRWVGRKIQDVLETEFGYDQPDDLLRAFEAGMIHVNGKQASLHYVLRDNDYICHRTHRHENPVTAAPIEVLENNKDLIVINKPSSIPCHPCGRYRFNSVVFILGKEMGLVNLRHIYRLDRLTSGVLILGKSPEITKVLMDQVVRRQVQKEYVCRVSGKFPEGTVKVDQPLAALSNKLRLQVISLTGKSSQTTFTRVSYNGKSSVVKCIPHTGRTHQIRVHLQYLGHPILNDAFYNSDAWGPNRGKNGVYELPFDKVCEQILLEHHNTKWAAGDNPMYEEKLRKLNANRLPNACAPDSNVSPADELYKISTDEPNADSMRTDKPNDNLPCTDDPRITESCELAKKSLHATTSPHDACAVSEVANSPQLQSSTDLEVRPHPQNLSNSNPLDTDKKMVETSAIDACSFKPQEQTHPAFDMSKWSVDLSCEICKRLSIDPEKKHLVMFLHALKYKGPGWEYETVLPEWASEDWSKEEDFIL